MGAGELRADFLGKCRGVGSDLDGGLLFLSEAKPRLLAAFGLRGPELRKGQRLQM